MSTTRLETERLIVRSFVEFDGPPWLELVNDDEVGRYLPPYQPVGADQLPAMFAARQAAEESRGYTLWAVELKDSGEFIGQCGLRAINEAGGPEVEIAYHYLPAAWNHGYGSEAATAVLDHGLHTLGLDEIVALVMPENIGSWRVMERAGMREAGMVDYFGLTGLKKYVAARSWWQRPPRD